MKTVFDRYIDRLQKRENITSRHIEHLCNRQHPWQINNLVQVGVNNITIKISENLIDYKA